MKKTLLTICWVLSGFQVVRAQVCKTELNAFTSQTGAVPTVDPATNALSFLRFPVQRAHPVPGNDVSQKAARFVSGSRAIGPGSRATSARGPLAMTGDRAGSVIAEAWEPNDP